MRAMVRMKHRGPLELRRRDVPEPGFGQLLLRVEACGVCRTDLHLVDDELPASRVPVVPGHEVVARVVSTGAGTSGRFGAGVRVGVPWLGAACGACRHCREGRENLCDLARFHGHDLDGGYAEFMLADERYCLPLPSRYGDSAAAPLLCAGLIGFRTLRVAGDPRRIGIYGFGAAAHIVTQVARHEGREVFALTRPGDRKAQDFARRLGAVWAGDSTEVPPELLDAALIFAPVGHLVPLALRAVGKGGIVVCGGIHMSRIPAFDYADLWGERVLRSVANLTRADGEAFMALAASMAIETSTRDYPLESANEALAALREGTIEGAAVLRPALSVECAVERP